MTRLFNGRHQGGKRRSRAFAWLPTFNRGFPLGVVTHDVTKEVVPPGVSCSAVACSN